jgi:hypothetical protein
VMAIKTPAARKSVSRGLPYQMAADPAQSDRGSSDGRASVGHGASIKRRGSWSAWPGTRRCSRS